MKQCKKCGELLSIDNFSIHPTSKDGHRNVCKKCYAKKRDRNNGTSGSEYERILAKNGLKRVREQIGRNCGVSYKIIKI